MSETIEETTQDEPAAVSAEAPVEEQPVAEAPAAAPASELQITAEQDTAVVQLTNPPVNGPKSVEDRFKEVVDQWVKKHIHNSPIAANTAAYNHLLSVLPKLGKLLTEGQ